METIQSKELHSSRMFLYSESKHLQVMQRCSLIASEKGNSFLPSDLHSEDMMNYFGTELLEKFLDRYECSSKLLVMCFSCVVC
jgi:hypothetical protein